MWFTETVQRGLVEAPQSESRIRGKKSPLIYKSYFGITVNAFRPLTGGPLKVYTNWEASCFQLTTTSTPITTLKSPYLTTALTTTGTNASATRNSTVVGCTIVIVLTLCTSATVIYICWKRNKGSRLEENWTLKRS